MKALTALLLWYVFEVGAALDAMGLDEARALWNRQTEGIPTDYSYVIFYFTSRRSLLVDVSDGAVQTVRYIGTGNNMDDPSQFLTIHELFEMIDSAQSGGSASVNATYNTQLGYPFVLTILYDDENVERFEVIITELIHVTIAHDAVQERETAWDALQISDYDFTVQVRCFCGVYYQSPKRIRVRGNEIVSIVDIETGEGEERYAYFSVHTLFQQIYAHLEARDDRVSVQYDPIYHFPTRVSVRPFVAAADASQTINVYAFSDVRGVVPLDPPTLTPVEEPTMSLSTRPSVVPSTSPIQLPSTAPSLALTREDLMGAWVRWNMTVEGGGGPMEYTFQYNLPQQQQQAPGTTPVIVTIQNGVITSVQEKYIQQHDDDGDIATITAGDDLLLSDFHTIPDLFVLMKDALLDDGVGHISAQFEAVYGYPTSIEIIYRRQSSIESIDVKNVGGSKEEIIFQAGISFITLYEILQSKVDTATTQWASLGWSDYDYFLLTHCNCSDNTFVNTQVKVRNGAVSPTDDQDQEDQDQPILLSTMTLRTIDGWLAFIQDAIQTRNVYIDVSYKEFDGYPISLSIVPEFRNEEVDYDETKSLIGIGPVYRIETTTGTTAASPPPTSSSNITSTTAKQDEAMGPNNNQDAESGFDSGPSALENAATSSAVDSGRPWWCLSMYNNAYFSGALLAAASLVVLCV